MNSNTRQRRLSFLVLLLTTSTVLLAGTGQPLVFFDSACDCNGNHGEYRWSVKTELQTPPASVPQDHQLKPSEVGAWAGPGGKFHIDTPRAGKEDEWFQVTGRVSLVKAEADGDLHIQLVDADGGSDVNMVVEVPVGADWCTIREQAFGWTKAHFPFTTTSSKNLSLNQHPVIRVTGMAFYDAAHAGKNTSGNRRPVTSSQVAIWEIHPVMKLELISN